MAKTKAIKILEKAFGFKLSPEQLSVIKYNHKTTTCIDSCAGAGKTTLLMFDIFLLLLTGQAHPKNILGITFSRDARKNMQVKYDLIKNKLALMGYPIKTNDAPHFRTFHSLFLRLLKCSPKFKHIRVISGYKYFKFILNAAIKFPNIAMSRAEQLKYIFQEYDQLINRNFSYDGININTHADAKELISNNWMIKDLKVTPNADININPIKIRRTINYISAVNTYQLLKRKKHSIDFNDMAVLLLKEMARESVRNKITQIMQPITYCFIDEYQDINNLQDKLLSMVLSQHAQNNLSVIGDDDQSIYSFRGSNPGLIINYLKNHKSAKRFQLTTNYRTNTNVLSGVKPLICDNKFRINKALKSANYDNGGLYAINNTPKSSYQYNHHIIKSSGLILLYSALAKAKTISNHQSIVILTRFNTDKMIATDFLANHSVMVKPNKLIQNNRVYKIYYHIINALVKNRTKYLIGYLKKIGFRTFAINFSKVYHRLDVHKRKQLSYVLKYLIKHDKSNNASNQILSKDLNLQGGIKSISYDVSGANVVSIFKDLTQDYFDYMTKHNFMSKDTYISISKYLDAEIKKYTDINDWIDSEKSKVSRIKIANRTRRYSKKIRVMTIHQSKGLQFNYVFLYNLSNRVLSSNTLKVDIIYHPNISRKEFLQKTLKLNIKDANVLDHINSKTIKNFDTDKKGYFVFKKHKAKHVVVYKLLDMYRNLLHGLHLIHMINRSSIIHNFKHSKHSKKHTKKIIKQDIKDTDTESCIKLIHNASNSKIQSVFNDLYRNTKETCAFVEEERRLIYVAITRAKSYTIFNVTDDPNPLLYELALDKHNILCLNKHNQLVPSVQDKETKERDIKSRMAKLRKMEKELQKQK